MILDKHVLKDYLTSPSFNGTFLIAYSGGLDSHVLLHLLSQLPDLSIRAIHIHHGLQSIADDWVIHCKKTCLALSIPFEAIHLNLHPKKGESIEQVARQGRYQAIKSIIKKDETLLTAQHQNDQSETLLLQLFRGAGVQGLASMPAITKFGSGKHARPLLSTTRQELETYAKLNKLESIEDPSNKDTSFDRNFLRKNILPKLRERWLGLDKALSRSASIQAETKQLLDEVAEADLNKICFSEENTLAIESLKLLSLIRQKLLLRYWIAKSGFKHPSEKKLKHIFTDAINARDDAQPLIEWQGAQIRRYKNKLYVMAPLSNHDTTQTFLWNTQEPLLIPSLKLTLKADFLHIKDQTVTVSFRQGGETLINTITHKKISLKNFLSETNIPPWERSRVPLIYHDNKLIQVIGLNKK